MKLYWAFCVHQRKMHVFLARVSPEIDGAVYERIPDAMWDHGVRRFLAKYGWRSCQYLKKEKSY